MKVKSFTVGTVNGVDDAIEFLDENVRRLGNDIVIHSIVDTVYEGEIAKQDNGSRIVRVIIYSY